MWSYWLPVLTAARVTRWALLGGHAEDHEEAAAGEERAWGCGMAVAVGVVHWSACAPEPEGGEAGGGAVGEVVLSEGEGEAEHADEWR
jgi:hypothetical protein